ncbi:MAG: signal peptidase I [Oscillospiraceae bacterium]|nr:signal peptidase I [Oscillospiraceae bacterium]
MDLKDMITVLAGFMLVYMLLFRVVVVVGPSMYDTLVDGDRLILVSNVLYREPRQGDVIVASKESFGGECIVKRVIATEGQTVDIDFDAGIVYVDGLALDEPYAHTLTTRKEGMIFPLTVEEDHVFVLGDNRNDSKDSRDPTIGLVDHREILGKVLFLMMPGDHYGTVERDFGRIGVVD